MLITQTVQGMRVTLNLTPFWDEKLTGAELAEELGMNPRSITSIRRGTERGNWETLVKLARYFSVRTGKEITIEDLLKIEE